MSRNKSQQAIDALVCGYGKIRDAVRLIMFKAYFDDSTSDEQDKILVLAGCVQSYKVWSDFSLRWEAALAETPSIRHFHMREARALEGEFLGWKRKDRDNKISLLANIVESYRPWVMVVWLSRNEHEEILKPIAPFLLRQPYVSLFYAAIMQLARWHLDMGIALPVEYIFDDQGEIGRDAALWYQHIKSWQPAEIAALMGGSPKFENDEMVLPLQAADMLAWHVRRRKARPNENPLQQATAPLENLHCVEVHIPERLLVDIANQMKDVPGIESVQQKPRRLEKENLRKVIRNLPTKNHKY